MMQLKVKLLPISTGGIPIAVIHEKDARNYNLHHGDRVLLKSKKNESVAIIDISSSHKMVKEGHVGLFEETSHTLNISSSLTLSLSVIPKPRSVYHIAKKLRGVRLNDQEIYEIVNDVVHKRLTDIEMTYFVSACYIRELSNEEIISFTKAMVQTGKQLEFGNSIVADKHCIGGVAGNRTTCIVVPIIAAAGYTIPKTSSRSITSPAGTSDTMEVLCKVTLSLSEMKSVIRKTNACMAWGGSMDIAPSDDTLIKVEHPMSLDPVGQMLASVLAKKKAAGATHCLIDIPVGKGAKIESRAKARMLKRKFEKIGKAIAMNVQVALTDGSEPIGNGIGPALEARDILWTLKQDERGSTQLMEKGIALAGKLLELLGEKKGAKKAEYLVSSGEAEKKFLEILEAQGLKIADPDKIPLGKYQCHIRSMDEGKITAIDNRTISRIARLAGAPGDVGAGVYLYAHKKYRVKKHDVIMTIYANSEEKLQEAVTYAKENCGFTYQ